MEEHGRTRGKNTKTLGKNMLVCMSDSEGQAKKGLRVKACTALDCHNKNSGKSPDRNGRSWSDFCAESSRFPVILL